LTQIKPVHPYPALLLQHEDIRALVVADLHIGWERILSQKGVHVPSQTTKIKNSLLKLLKTTKPTQLVVLGDIKDAITQVPREEWEDIPDFFESIQKQVPKIRVVIGNHDGNIEPLLPETVEIVPATGTTVGDVGLFHGHAWPSPELLGCKSLITGHVHPTIAIRDPLGFRVTKQVLLKASCNAEKLAKKLLKSTETKAASDTSAMFNGKLLVSQLFILPSFNQFLGGRPVNEKTKTKTSTEPYVGPILRSGCVDMNEAEAYLLDGTFLGTVEQLKQFS
jgi:putative SbcD/Mre11-related phosphoesterase